MKDLFQFFKAQETSPCTIALLKSGDLFTEENPLLCSDKLQDDEPSEHESMCCVESWVAHVDVKNVEKFVLGAGCVLHEL